MIARHLSMQPEVDAWPSPFDDEDGPIAADPGSNRPCSTGWRITVTEGYDDEVDPVDEHCGHRDRIISRIRNHGASIQVRPHLDSGEQSESWASDHSRPVAGTGHRGKEAGSK
ncbi:hypothetical protein [Rhodococcus jostii]|uniref:hypothetical protein n=1 Tax=Rhodococcus jostii TaxID=132919 RepID=UPI00365D3A18